jgi:hypothetical protein
MPQRTLQLLDELTSPDVGMTDNEFQQLHQFGRRGRRPTIRRHREYCEDLARRGGAFQPDANNERTRERLRTALERIRAGATWPEAIDAALRAVPIAAVPDSNAPGLRGDLHDLVEEIPENRLGEALAALEALL